MLGTNSATGSPLSGIDYLRQLIRDLLTTRLGSRVMRRDYGSRLPDLVDAPLNSFTLVEIYYATASAIKTWLSDIFNLGRVFVQSITAGQIVLSLTGTYLENGQAITLDGIVIS